MAAAATAAVVVVVVVVVIVVAVSVVMPKAVLSCESKTAAGEGEAMRGNAVGTADNEAGWAGSKGRRKVLGPWAAVRWLEKKVGVDR